MKAIKIKTEINLTTGLFIPDGGIVVINEGYANLKGISEGLIPCQIINSVYSSELAYNEGKSAVDGSSIADFNPAMYNLFLTVVNYQTQTAEDLLINAVYDYLSTIYPNNVEIINL